MHPFPPSTSEKTAFVKAALRHQAGMPEPAIELVGQYISLNADFINATALLKFDRHGQVTNRNVYEAIREALISNVCELQIKRQIFLNLLADKSRISRTIFDIMQKEIHAAGYQVNLDYVDLSYLKLSRLNFSGMSMRNADLSHSIIVGSKFIHTDLSQADFSYSHLRLVNMEDALLFNANWRAARLNRLNMFGAEEVDLSKAREANRIMIDSAMAGDRKSNQKYQLVKEFADNSDALPDIDERDESESNPCCCLFL